MLCLTIAIVYCVFQCLDQFLNFCRGNRIQRRAGLVHQYDLRFDRESAGDAQTLLLATGQSVCVGFQPVFDFVPQRG